MQLKKPNKSLILLLSLLLIGTPTNSQASQTHSSSNPKKLVIPMLAFTFLSNRLMNLSNSTQSGSLFVTIHKLKNAPETLTKEEKQKLSQYVGEETIQLGNELPSIKDHNKLQTKQNTYQQLTSLQQQLALLHKASFPQTIHRPGELIIPANGKCLYTSIILGYLLPVVNNQKAFAQRLRMIMDKQKLPITPEDLANHYNDPHYLDSNPAFQQIIHALLKQTGIKPGTWGGPQEIKLIAEKLNVNIQEYTPNPDSPKQLIKGDLTSPKNWLNAPEATLHVVQDTPLKGELVNPDDDLDLQQGQLSSLQGLQNRHHYRLYYTGTLPQPMPKAPTNQNNKPEQPQQKHTDEEHPNHTAKFLYTKPPLPSRSPSPDNVPQPKTSLPDLLKTHYKAQNQIPGLLGDAPQPLESCYIHLAMLTEEEHKVKKEKFLKKQPNPDDDERKEDEPQEEEKSWSKSMDYAILHKVQKPIKLEDIWKPQEKKEDKKDKNKEKVKQPSRNKPPRHVVITGEAGTGKSTLSQYIAYQWATGDLWQGRFNWVLQIPLRKIRNLHNQQSSHNQIATALGIPNVHGKDLQGLLQQKQPGLLILDGYDEVAIEVQKDNSHLAQWLQPCFDNKDNLSIILTTRPGPHCPYVKQPRDLRVLGFQQQDIDRYVETYFTPEKQQNKDSKPTPNKKASALLKVMQQNPTLKLLSHTPLYLRLLCILAKQQGADALSKCSTPQLYQQIIAQFLCYNLARHNNKPPTDEEQDLVFKTYGLELAYLGELAFEGMKASQAVLPVDLQKKLLKKLRLSHPRTSATAPEHWTRIASLGLLQGYTCSSPRPNLPTYFPHLTIQEWLAAHYLVTALYDNQHKDHHTAKAIINQDKYAPRYQVMLPFVAGICYQHICNEHDLEGKALTAFWTLLNAQPRELAGIHHAMLVARCLEACRADTSSTMPQKLQKHHKILIKQVAGWLQALLNHPFDEKDVIKYGRVLLPGLAGILPAGLQGCPILLGHQLITQHVKPNWPKLSLEGKWRDITTKRWYTRVAKIKALARLPLSHHTTKTLSTYLQQALQHQCKYVRSASARVLPGVLQALESQDRKALMTPFIGALKDNHWQVREAAAGALPGVIQALEPEDRKACINPFIGTLKDEYKDWLGHYPVRKAAALALPDVLQALEPQDRKALMIPIIGALKDKDGNVRSASARALPGVIQALESQDRKALMIPFIGALKDKDSNVRSASARVLPGVLKALEPEDRKGLMIPFIGALKDKDRDVREAAADALPGVLQNLESQDRKGLMIPIIDALKDKEYWVRKAAAEALPSVLGSLEPQDRKALMIPFIGALKDKDGNVRGAAAGALPGVIQALESQDRKALMIPFIDALKDKNEYLRYAAAEALPGVLQNLAPQDRKAFIIGALKDKNEDVRYAAVEALPSVLASLESQDRKACINPFIGTLKDKDMDVRRAVARTLPGVLQNLAPQDRKALMIPFIGALNVEYEGFLDSYPVRSAAIGALPGVLQALASEDRKAFITPFLNALKDEYKTSWGSYPVRVAAARALPGVLQALEPEERKAFTTPLINALKDDDYDVRSAAAEALPGVLQALESQDRKACINPFIDALKDKNWSVRSTSARVLPGVLKALEPEDRKACINPFIDALKDKNLSVRWASACALPGVLKALEPEDRKAFIINALKDKNWSVRRAAAGALPGVLQALESQDRKACINPFIGALKDKNAWVREKAAQALPSVLASLESQDRKALMIPFIGTLKDKARYVREAAAGALQEIDNKIWQSGLQYQLQAKPQQQSWWSWGWDQLFGSDLETWAYGLLRGSLLICFSNAEQRQLPSYLMFIQTLQTQANTWGWPVHAYSVKPLADDFNPSLPKLPAITIHRPLAYTPLHDAAQKGNVQALETLWQDSYYHQYLNDQHNQDQLTPLLCALKGKKWKAAQWLMNKGAWLDMADTKDKKGLVYTCLELLLPYINPKTPHLAKLAVTLLSQRTLFSIALIERHLTYAEEKEQTEEDYDQALCTAVAQLLGNPVDALYKLLHDLNNRKLYRAAALNMLESKQQGLGKMDFTKKGWDADFLKFRIAVLYDLLVRIKKKHFIIQLPTNQSTKKYYRNKEVYEMGLKELQVVLTTFWDYKTLEGCFGEPKFYKAWAQGIIHRLPSLRLPQETSLFLSYTTELNYGHCIYVSLTKTSTHYIVRIDNRWIDTAPNNAHPEQKQTFHQKEKTCIQPCPIAYFPVQDWDTQQKWLLSYITKVGQVNGKFPFEVIPCLYQKNKKTPKIGDKPTWIKQLPWRPLQIDENNCFMRSHNVGYRIRLGNDLYEWFRQKALGSYLLDEKFVKRQLSSSPSKGPKLQGGPKLMGNNKQNPEKTFKLDEEETKEESPQLQTKHKKHISFKQPQPKKTVHQLQFSPSKSIVKQSKSTHKVVNKDNTKYTSKKRQPKQITSPKKLLSFQEVKQQWQQQASINYFIMCHFVNNQFILPQPTLPTHQEVLQRFYQQLRINDHNTMLHSKAIQQALVGYAGLTRSQQGARFDRNSYAGHTCFVLRITPDEAERFIGHYLMHHVGWIQDMRLMKDDWLYLLVNTAQLYHEIIPTLSLRQQKARKTGYNKQQGQGHQVMNTNKKPQSEDTKYTSPKKSKFKKSSPKPTTSSKKLPSHQEVMKRFAKKLRVNYDAVYSGIAAEQAIVRYAGINHLQTGAMFRRDSQTGYTWFKLHLNSYEANLFMDHYQTLHPDAIKKRTTLGNGWVRIVFDTARLYHEIIPNLV